MPVPCRHKYMHVLCYGFPKQSEHRHRTLLRGVRGLLSCQAAQASTAAPPDLDGICIECPPSTPPGVPDAHPAYLAAYNCSDAAPPAAPAAGPALSSAAAARPVLKFYIACACQPHWRSPHKANACEVVASDCTSCVRADCAWRAPGQAAAASSCEALPDGGRTLDGLLLVAAAVGAVGAILRACPPCHA